MCLIALSPPSHYKTTPSPNISQYFVTFYPKHVFLFYLRMKKISPLAPPLAVHNPFSLLSCQILQ